MCFGNSTSGLHTNAVKAGAPTNTCTPTFTAALFTIAKRRKRHACAWMGEGLLEMWCMHTVKYYSASKRKKILSRATTWVNLEGMLYEAAGYERPKAVGSHLEQRPERSIHGGREGNRGAGVGGGGKGNWCLVGTKREFGKMEGCGGGTVTALAQHRERTSRHGTVHSNPAKMVSTHKQVDKKDTVALRCQHLPPQISGSQSLT